MNCPKHGEQSTFCRFCDADTIEAQANKTPPFNWFGPMNQRVSVYADGTVEIQCGDASFRAMPSDWMLAAATINGLRPVT